MLTSSRLFYVLTLVVSLGLASLASAADGVIYIDDLKSLDRALQETPALRAGRPPAYRTAPQLQKTPRPEVSKKESFLNKITPSWMRGGEKKETARPQATASRTPSRFDNAVTQAAHTSQRSPASLQQAPSKRPSPRAGGIAMRRDTQPRAGLLDGLMGKPAPQAKPRPASHPRPASQPAAIASRQPMRTPPSIYKPAALPKPMARTPVASRRPTPQGDLPRIVATPAVMAMAQSSRAPQANPFVNNAKINEAVAIESKPLQFDDMVFVSDADVEKIKTPKVEMPEAKFAMIESPALEQPAAKSVAEVAVAPSPQPMTTGPRLLAQPPVQETAPQKLVATPYPTAERAKAPQNDREPSERARMLLAEAHALAAEAASSEEFSAIVQRCRYVLAIDESSQAIAYANQLASWSLNKRGESFVDKGRLTEGESDFLEALRCDDTCWRAEHNLAVLEAQRENYDSARERFSRTIELNPEYAKAYCNRAALSVQSSDFSSAMQDYGLAIEANPDLAIAHIGRGRVCHMLGHLDQALQHLDAAELLQPRDASIVIGRGDLLVDLGRYGHAKAAYERAIALDPSRPTAYRNLAWMQATCPISEFHDGEAALANATKGAELAGEEDDIALDTRAAALAATGQFEQAVELQKQAIEIAPETDAKVYRERLTMYEQGEVFMSQPIGGVVHQTTFTK